MSMTEPARNPFDTPAPAEGATDLASHVAAKLCHDFISPSGAIVSGLDLLKDPTAQDMREEAMSLIEASARKLVSIVHFARVAFGAATTSERFDARELETLVRGMFEHVRAELDWRVSVDTFEKPHARALLNLAQIGAGALPTGGVATLSVQLEDGGLAMRLDAKGPRARLKTEVATGLRGDRLTEGLAGQWIQPFWLHEVVRDAGGTLDFDTAEERVEIVARVPA
ncbi:MAG TPA: histidine phosphotransferase family protein [Caulobacteraceae bacterium]|nr:histidine phosphotransferase family protein [Caulobacteraceae bacterium]